MDHHIELFEDQNIFANAVFSDKFLTYVYAGSIRAGKTICIMTILLAYCKIFPGSKWIVIRKTRPSLKLTTLATFQHYVLPPGLKHVFNASDLIYSFPQWKNSQIIFMEESYDTDKDFKRFLGLEANGFFLSQAEDLQYGLYQAVISRAGQWKTEPMAPTAIFVDLNPTDQWPRELFNQPWVNGTLPENLYYQAADIFKNPYVTPKYLEDLKASMTSKMYERFLLNNWSAMVGGIIQGDWFKVIEEHEFHNPKNKMVRFWDLAVSTKKAADESSGAKCSLENDRFLIWDIQHGKLAYPDLRRAIIAVAQVDGPECIIAVEEAGQQLGFIDDLRVIPELRGYTIQSVKPHGDKYNRAMPWAARAEAGWVDIVRGKWNDAFKSQCDSFTADDSHAHDDMIDSVSGAYQVIAVPKPRYHFRSFED